MISIGEHPEGAILPVWVQAGARQNAIRGAHAGFLKVAVTSVAEKGKANQAVLELLAEVLGLPVSRFELLAGPTQPRKRVLVRDCPPAVLRQRLASIIPPSKK